MKPQKAVFSITLFWIIFVLSLNLSAQSWEEHDSLRVAYIEQENYEMALEHSLKALELVKEEVGKKDTLYADKLAAVAYIYYTQANHNEAIKYLREEYDIRKAHKDEDLATFEKCSHGLANLLFYIRQYEESLPYFLESLESYQKVYGERDSVYAFRLDNIARIYQIIGAYDDAKLYFEEAIELVRQLLGKRSSSYGILANNIARLYYQLGEYEKAMPMYYESLEAFESTFGKEHANYGIILDNMANLYQVMGQYDKALSLYLEARENFEKSLGKEHYSYAICITNLGNLYKLRHKYDEAMPLYQQALQIAEKTVGKDSWRYGTFLNNLAALYDDLGEYDKALPLYIESVENAEKTLGKDHAYYGIRISNLAFLYQNMKRYDEALPLFIEVLENTEKSLGKEHRHYSSNLMNLASLYTEMDLLDSVLPLYREAFQNNYLHINRAFSFLSEQEKENFIKTISLNFNNFQNYFVNYSKKHPEVGADVYNIELATKGMILQSGIEMRQTILNSGDTKALEKYDEWADTRKELSRQFSLEISDRSEDIGSLEQKANRLEGELNRISRAFNQVNRLTGANWHNVKKNLKENEAAIEFTSYRYRKGRVFTDSIMYAALIVAYGYEHPLIVPLFEEGQVADILDKVVANNLQYINDIYGKNDYRTPQAASLYALIWKPLEKYLEDINTIYLSPTGLLHKVSFAAISNEQHEYLCDIYDINLVSSTSQISEQDLLGLNIKKLALFGGVNYNSPETQNEIWEYLEGTLIETKKLAKKLNNAGIETMVYTGVEATEERFKKVAGDSDVLHIATHGFFYPDPEKVREEKQERISIGEVAFRGGQHGFGVWSFMENPNPLMRSGLVFAGANDVWNERERDPGKEDGVLTAHEVANMDLQNTQLVVLSACETGLGDIQGSEGVYGLQRAFKMAGVKNIIMSLWQVPDKETVEFMEIFYDKLLDSNDIRNAFSETQREMRQKCDPFYWAAFVLIE